MGDDSPSSWNQGEAWLGTLTLDFLKSTVESVCMTLRIYETGFKPLPVLFLAGTSALWTLVSPALLVECKS